MGPEQRSPGSLARCMAQAKGLRVPVAAAVGPDSTGRTSLATAHYLYPRVRSACYGGDAQNMERRPGIQARTERPGWDPPPT